MVSRRINCRRKLACPLTFPFVAETLSCAAVCSRQLVASPLNHRRRLSQADNELEREQKAVERQEELEERRLELDQEREDRRKERDEDRAEREAARAHQLELAKLENEKYAMMLKLAMMNSSGGAK
ncbi:hypothetical protein DVH05_000486 [Phytophthora capsici]|nr:hypothetical protein DVH05_000486 [Phytophthora capsici]